MATETASPAVCAAKAQAIYGEGYHQQYIH